MAKKHLLVSIPASHYCERARWALDYAGIEFEESKWPPMLHYMGTLPVSGTWTVPVLRCPNTATKRGKVLTDSADIVGYADDHLRAVIAERTANPADSPPAPNGTADPILQPLYPYDPEERRQVEELEQMFARKLGVWTRVVAYQHLFADRPKALDVLALRQPGQPALLSGLFRVVYPVVRAAICRGMRVNEEAAEQCTKRVREVFDEVGAMLSRNPSGYLVGDHFTAADLTFAAMTAVLLCPPAYGAYLPPLEGAGAWPPTFPGHELAGTPAGRHALEMYRRHRGGGRGGLQPQQSRL